MIDMIFVVSDPKQWHNANLKLNSDHYALPMRWLGGRSVSCVQGDGVYFNPFVRLGDNVVTTEALRSTGKIQ
jgi:translocator assembly and maintenance protein 41